MTEPAPRPRRAAPGFTLVETMLALGLSVSVVAMSLPFLHTARRLWDRAEHQREARRALDGAVSWISRDLRQAGYNVPGPPLLAAEAGRLSYMLSRDGSGPAGRNPSSRRLITVFVDEGDLKYRIQAPAPPPGSGWNSGSTQVLAPGVASLRCAPIGRDGAAAADASAAALVSCVAASAHGEERRFTLRLRSPCGSAP